MELTKGDGVEESARHLKNEGLLDKMHKGLMLL